MSWVVEEWKEGLSTKVLHKIQELESQLEKLRKERQQRQFQLESLEAALQKQKQKVESEKNEGATLKRENQSLIELCDNLEKTRQKLSHELQVKESQVSFQEGQLLSSKKQIERLEQELKKCKSELEKIPQNPVAGDSSFSSTPQKSFTVPSTPSHNDSRYEELQAKYMKEVEENKKLEAELKSMKSHKANPLLPQTTMSRREIARQQASSSVFSWQQEQTPNRPPSNSQETPMSGGLHFPWELGATPSHQDLKSAKKDFPNSILGKSKNSPLIDKMKIQNQELRSRVQELEHNLQIQTNDVKLHRTKLQETQLQVENLKRELTEKSQALNKSNNEITRITAQLDQTTAQFVVTEEKMKRLSEELNCQRQNAESAQHSLEQKVKEKEKEYQEELSCQLTQVRTKLQEELQQAKANSSRLQADVEKIQLEKQRLEHNADDLTLRLNVADQAMETMQLKENELRSNFEEVKKQNSLFSSLSGQQSQEIGQLKEDLHMTKQLLQQSQSLCEEMKSKNWSLERELEILKNKVNKQDESVEKMQLAISDLEKQQASLQQLLNNKENTIEKLHIQLKDLERLQNVLAECEILKKEVEILSQRKKNHEQLLDQFRSEKEGLMSKMYSLENALMTEQIKSNDRVTVAEVENERLRTEIKNLRCVVEGKSTELEEQRLAYCKLQQQSVTLEETFQKERENNSLKLSESTKQMNVLQQILQSTANEISEKEKRIASLETSLASHMQSNAGFQKQFEELIQVRDEMERKLAEAERKHEGFVRESEEHIGKLRMALSEKQVIITKASAAVEEKDKELQLLIKESKRQETDIQDLKISNKLLEDLVQRLQSTPQTASYQEPELPAATSLSDKEIRSLKDKNVLLQSAIDTLEQRHVDIMETNVCISNNSQDQHENLMELSERCREKSTLFLQAEEGLERNCTSLEAKNNNLECSLRAQGLPFEVEKAEFEYQEKKLMNPCEELHCQLLSSDEKNSILLRQLEKMQVVLEEAEIAPVQKVLSAELYGLEPKRTEQNTVQQHYDMLLQENKQVIEEIKIRNNRATGAFASFGASLEQLRISVKEKEDELDKYQVKLELIQMDLEDKEVSVKNYADQVQKLETALRAMEVKIEESEREKQGLKQEIQALKNLENSTLEIAEGDKNARPPATVNVVTKDSFNQQIDAKCSSAPHDLTPSQNDYVQLVSSLHMTMSKLNELEKMCEHLQIEKSTLASQLKGSQLECITDRMAEELRTKMNTVKKERVAFSDELDQSEMEKQFEFEKMFFMDLDSCSRVNYEDLKLSNKEIKAHFDGVKEKILSLKNQYQYLYDQNVSVVSKLSELQCVIEMLKEESPALSARPSQADTVSFVSQMTPSYVNKEFLLDGSLCLWSSWHSSMAGLAESNFDSDQYRPPNEITKQDSRNKQSELEGTPDIHHHITELCDDGRLVHILKQGQVVPKMYSLKSKRDHLMLFDTHDKSFKRLKESFVAHKNLEDEEIQKIQQLLLSARKEVNCLRQQNVLDSEQWQQKLHNVILEVVSKLPAEQNDTEILSRVPEEPRLQSQELNSSSQPLLSFGTEHQVTESRMVSDQPTSSSQSPAVLLFHYHNTNAVPENIPEYHRSTEMSPQQINETCTLKSKLSHEMNESSKVIDTLVMEVQNLNSRLDSQDEELAMKTAACEELEKTVVELEKEKEGLSETLKSVTFDNQQLSYNLLSLEIELSKVKSDLDTYKVRLSDTQETLEELEMAKSDWNEQLLEAENELRRIKAERENIEIHALSMEADIEELQSKKEQLGKENENKLKTIFGLQEQLHIITAERNQFSQDLNALSKDKEELNYMCQKLQDRIKDLQSSQRDSTEFIRVLESEAKTQTKLLHSTKDDIAQLSTEKDCLILQLQNLEKVASDLVLEKEMAQSLIECLSEEKEVILRECETLRTQLNNSATEISKISKSLEGSLIEKGELAARLNSAQEEVDQLRQGIEKLKIRIESDEKKRYCLAQKLKESARKADALVDKVENLERELQLSEENFEGAILEVEAAKEEKEIAHLELEKMRANLGKLEAEMNLLKSEREQLERELKEEQEKASHLECSNSMLVKQLKEKDVQRRSEYENALLSVQSQLNQAREEIKGSHSKHEMYKAKEQELMDEVTSLQHENTQLAHYLQQAKYKHSETEELMGALIQELRDIKLQLDENDSFLEQLATTEALHAALEDPQASYKDPEEHLGATAPAKGASLEKACYHRLLEQLKNGEKIICPKFQQWVRSFRVVKQEREQMLTQICELKSHPNRTDPHSHQDTASEEIVLELERLRESIEEKTREADQNVEKYCALIIDHHKLEEENEMLKTQISLLNVQLKQSSSSAVVSCPWQSPGNPGRTSGGMLIEKTMSEGVAKVHRENRERRDKETRSPLQETLFRNIKNRATSQQHNTTWPQNSAECESDGFPEMNEGFIDTVQILEMDYFPENPKATAEGSKLQKMDDAQLQEIQAPGSCLGCTPRSPLSACNQSTQPIADRAAGSTNPIKTRLSDSTAENELNEGCHVQ